jgi:branched-chain amino acid transport system permease protein
MGLRRKATLVIWAAIGVSLFLLPLVIKEGYTLNLSILFLLSAGLAASWNILGGYTGQISMGHSIFFGVGALATRFFWTSGVPFAVALLVGGIGAIITAAIIGLPSLKLRGPYFAIGTLVTALVAYLAVGNVLAGLASLPGPYLAKYTILKPYYATLIAVTLLMVASYILVNSRIGSTLRAISDDQDAAEALGVNTFKYKALALEYSALFTGLFGGIFAFYQVSYYYAYPFDLTWSFSPLLISFVGGAGTLLGPVIGAVIWVGLTEFLAITLGEVHGLVFGIGLMVVVIFMPGGIVERIDRISMRYVQVFRKKVSTNDRKFGTRRW